MGAVLKVEKFDVFGEISPVLINPDKHEDERGFFLELFNSEKMQQLGLPEFVQDNMSVSRKNVFRGLHWQKPPMGQGKLVTCLSGAIQDFAVDVRKSSPSFGEVASVILDSNGLSSFWVPEGFAHGFLALEDNTTVLYKVSSFWSKDHEVQMSAHGLDVSVPPEGIMSEKDKESPSLNEMDKKDFF